jgi:hypothetical protein
MLCIYTCLYVMGFLVYVACTCLLLFPHESVYWHNVFVCLSFICMKFCKSFCVAWTSRYKAGCVTIWYQSSDFRH